MRMIQTYIPKLEMSLDIFFKTLPKDILPDALIYMFLNLLHSAPNGPMELVSVSMEVVT